jgi:hypothetical protein
LCSVDGFNLWVEFRILSGRMREALERRGRGERGEGRRGEGRRGGGEGGERREERGRGEK